MCLPCASRQKGLALVETVITLPLLLLVMLAASEFTNAFIQHTTLTKAVRDGARYVAGAAIGGAQTVDLTPELVQETQRLVVYGDRDEANGQPVVQGLTVADVSVTNLGGDNIEVSVTHDYTGILGSVLPTFGYGDDISLLFTLQATVTMRAL